MYFSFRPLYFVLITFAALFSVQPLHAQTTTPPKPTNALDTLGQIIWHVPSKIDSLEKSSRGKNELRGYRVQVFLGSMTDAKNFRQKAISSGLTQPAYIIQNAPDYAVRMGDFKSLFEAQLFLTEAKKHFPSAFLVHDKIEPPRYKRSPQ
jgi:hypothetical protein